MPDGRKRFRRIATRTFLLFLIFFPPVYVVMMAWRSAILVPFWDEWELARLLVSWWDGAFPLNAIFRQHNEHRPLLSWLTMMALARWTDWSIRAEHALNIWFIFALFALISASLCRIHRWKFDRPFLISLALISILVFSPAQNICHWWSFLLVLNSSALYAVAAFVTIAAAPARLSSNLLAAAFCWMSGYSAANGLLTFPICTLLMQLGQERRAIPGKYGLFWAANMALFSFGYFPGLAMPAMRGMRPGLFDMGAFFLGYIGSPVACLITFPFKNIWDVRKDFSPLHIMFGILTLSALATMLWRERIRLFQGGRESRLPIAFYLLSLVSALMISYGRAQLGVHTAFTSRYILYSTFLPLGLILHASALYQQGRLREFLWIGEKMGRRLFLIFALTSIITFGRGIMQYERIRQLNQVLETALLSNPRIDYVDLWLYPNPGLIQDVILGLKRHRIGPYRGIKQCFADMPSLPGPSAFAKTLRKSPGAAGRIEVLKVDYSGPRPGLDITGWAAPMAGKPEPYFVVIDIDGGLFRAMVPVGLPVTGFLPFSLPDPGLPILSGWGKYWTIDLKSGKHKIKAYSYFPEASESYQLGEEIKFDWRG